MQLYGIKPTQEYEYEYVLEVASEAEDDQNACCQEHGYSSSCR